MRRVKKILTKNNKLGILAWLNIEVSRQYMKWNKDANIYKYLHMKKLSLQISEKQMDFPANVMV